MERNTEEITKSTIENFLYLSGIHDYFWGGSRRFKTSNDLSDYDMFILGGGEICDEYNYTYFQFPGNLNKSMFTERVINEIYVGNHHYRSVIFNAKVDFIFIPLLKDYEFLRGEHDEIEEFMEYNPLVRKLISRISSRLVKGTVKYRIIRNLMYEQDEK
jgi:hypothetical protein